MAHRTVPPATSTDFSVAFSGALVQARAHGLDVTSEPARATLAALAEVIAQQQAEIRWARGFLHPQNLGLGIEAPEKGCAVGARDNDAPKEV